MEARLRIIFDPDKDASKRAKHRLPLDVTAMVIENAVETFRDTRFDYGEDRFVTFGYVEHRLHVAVWTERDGEIRAISVRKANEREQERYGR